MVLAGEHKLIKLMSRPGNYIMEAKIDAWSLCLCLRKHCLINRVPFPWLIWLVVFFSASCSLITVTSIMSNESIFKVLSLEFQQHHVQEGWLYKFHWPIKVVFAVLFLVLLVGGTLMLYGVSSYEKNGGDPQKRNLSNILLSQLCWTFLVGNLATMPFLAWRSFVGPLGHFGALVGMISGRICSINAILCFNETVIVKCLYTFAWNKMAAMDETFFGHIMGIFNVMFSVSMHLTNYYLQIIYTEIYTTYSGLLPPVIVYR